MRRNLLAILILALLLLAPLAAAAKGSGREDAQAHADSMRGRGADDNETRDENRTRGGFGAFVQGFLERWHALRESFHAKAADVREACRGDDVDRANMTGDEKRAWAHCVRDGMQELRNDWKMKRVELRDEWRAAHDEWRASHDA